MLPNYYTIFCLQSQLSTKTAILADIANAAEIVGNAFANAQMNSISLGNRISPA